MEAQSSLKLSLTIIQKATQNQKYLEKKSLFHLLQVCAKFCQMQLSIQKSKKLKISIIKL